MASQTTKSSSQFIAAARITMIIGLVVHHLFEIPNSGFFPRYALDANFFTLANTLNSLIHWTTMAAVPLLSIISGYLYFNRPLVKHRVLLVKRMHSILLPSIAWTTVWLIFAYVMVTIGRPHGQFQWLDYGFNNINWLTLLNGIFGITREPFAFQFWFIHDLVLTLLLAPAISWLLHRVHFWFILALTTIWLLDIVPPPFFSLNVLFFFSLGALLAIRSVSLEEAIKAAQRWQLPVFILFLLILITRSMSDLHPVFGSHVWLCILRFTGVVTVSIVIFAILQRPDSFLHKLSYYSPYAFFIFASHYPLIEFFKAVFKRIPMQDTAIGQLLSLLIIPAATTITCIVSAMLLARFTPGLFAFLNGGRAPQPRQY